MASRVCGRARFVLFVLRYCSNLFVLFTRLNIQPKLAT